MKRGFTLLEIIVVVVILGVLATLGIDQYYRAVEKSRSAEAKQVIGHIRERASAFFSVHETLDDGGGILFDDDAAGIGWPPDGIPQPVICADSHWFGYRLSLPSSTSIEVTAVRCTSAGKPPFFEPGGTVALVADFNSGVDTWTYSPVYQ